MHVHNLASPSTSWKKFKYFEEFLEETQRVRSVSVILLFFKESGWKEGSVNVGAGKKMMDWESQEANRKGSI